MLQYQFLSFIPCYCFNSFVFTWAVVLIPVELEQLLQSEGHSLGMMDSVPLDFPWSQTQPPGLTLESHQGSGSGGYADLIFIYAAKELFGNSHPELQYKSLRYVFE